MRIIKTCLAIFICLLVGYILGINNPSSPAIIALFCIGTSLESTWDSSKNRIIGTVLAGIYAYFFLLAFSEGLGLYYWQFSYLLLVALGTLILMQLLVKLHLPKSNAIAAMTFLSATLSPVTAQLPYLPRHIGLTILETLLGILSALLVDWLPPLNNFGKELHRAQGKTVYIRFPQAPEEAENHRKDAHRTAPESHVGQPKI